MKNVVRKTYETIHKNIYQCSVRVGDDVVLCHFVSGGQAKNKKGSYSTTNPDVQKALESRPAFGVKYKLRSEIEVPKEEAEEEKVEVRSPKINPPTYKELKQKLDDLIKDEDFDGADEFAERVDDEDIRAEFFDIIAQERFEAQKAPEGVKVVSKEEVSNVQGAKDYLCDNFEDVVKRNLTNKEVVLQVAEKKGVQFEAFN